MHLFEFKMSISQNGKRKYRIRFRHFVLSHRHQVMVESIQELQ